MPRCTNSLLLLIVFLMLFSVGCVSTLGKPATSGDSTTSNNNIVQKSSENTKGTQSKDDNEDAQGALERTSASQPSTTQSTSPNPIDTSTTKNSLQGDIPDVPKIDVNDIEYLVFNHTIDPREHKVIRDKATIKKLYDTVDAYCMDLIQKGQIYTAPVSDGETCISLFDNEKKWILTIGSASMAYNGVRVKRDKAFDAEIIRIYDSAPEKSEAFVNMD